MTIVCFVILKLKVGFMSEYLYLLYDGRAFMNIE
jgi:hypothetical protein